MIQKGYLPEAILNYIALLGWAPETDQEIYTLEELVQAFNVQHIGTSGAIFDMNKLTWVNAQWLRAMSLDQYTELVKPYIVQSVKGNFDITKIAKILQNRAETLLQIPEMVDFFDHFPAYDNDLYNNKKMKTNPEIALISLKAALRMLEEQEEWNEQAIHDKLMELPAKLELKNGQVLFPLRLAISGKQFTPGGAIELADILGKEETLRRLRLSITQLEP